MSRREDLEQYLKQLRRRIRAATWIRAVAVGTVGALALVVLFVWLMQRAGFPDQLTLLGRISLLALLALVAGWLIALPLHRLRRHDGAAELERRLPQQSGRLTTYLDARRREQQGTTSVLTDLLAADALHPERAPPVSDVVRSKPLWAGALLGAAAIAATGWLIVAGQGFWGYGSRHLLLAAPIPREVVPPRIITVKPGDVTVRRNSDLTIRATIEGFVPDSAQVFVRFSDQASWERAPMQVVPSAEGEHWEFRLFALRGALQYYVAAQDRRGETRSGEHSVGVVDLPKIDRVRLTYRYPQWTDLPQHTDDVTRDIRAVAATKVDVEVFADAPLDAPVMVVDGEMRDMKPTATGGIGTLEVEKPGSYHIGAHLLEDLVVLTDEYRIEIVEDQTPSIEIKRPGRDWRATSIEEVPVAVQAKDDFRLQQVELRYSVNGGEERARRLAAGSRQADVNSLLRMEELGPDAKELLVPGDLVSYYAVARDRGKSVETDLFVVEVQPFERRFRTGQGGGGGGGDGMGEQGAISERQREILLATWNTQRSAKSATRGRDQLVDSARMLSELQVTLATQARNLAERTRARSVVDQDPRIKQFVEALDQAAAAMDPAAKHLADFKLDEAIPLEQQALQQLLRAESAFREVQIAMQREQSQGSGGQEALRNFTEMFELEMDVDKNHYETGSSLSERNDTAELDEAIRKLKELAERQQRLAEQARRNMPAREQRWQQEQLRREAEDLRRRLEELSRSQQAQQQAQNQSSQSNGSSSGQSSGQSSNQSGSESSQGQQRDTSQSALEAMRRALEEMRAANAGAEEDRTAANRAAQQASENLRRALEQMQQPTGGSMAEELQQLADRAGELVREQQRVESELYEALGDAMGSARLRGQLAPERAKDLIESKQRMGEDVTDIQQQMRAAINDHGARNPQAARRLSEALSATEETNLAYRLERSAMQIRYGRAREAAPSEGLIAEALDALENDLRVIAQVAASEKSDTQGEAQSQRLLAELGELRRALRAAEREGSGQPGDARQAQAGEQQGSQEGQAQAEGEPGQRGGAQQPANRGGSALTAWNPQALSAPLEDGSGQFRSREAAEIARRLEDLANRPERLDLSADDINALRRMAREARGLNPRALQSLQQQVDRLELATLASLHRSREQPAAHSSASAPDAPQLREAIAEYYRRLGGVCTNAEGADAC